MALVVLLFAVFLWCNFGPSCWIWVVDEPAVIILWGYVLQGEYFYDHMVKAFRVLDYFFLFPLVIFASINSYEKCSCSVVWNLTFVITLGIVLCVAEWQLLYVQFFEDSSFWSGIGHDLDMFIIPVVVAGVALGTSIAGMIVHTYRKQEKKKEEDQAG
jgi:hypothetical protein